LDFVFSAFIRAHFSFKEFPMSTPLPSLQPWLDDPAVAEIMIDGWQQVYVERNGCFEKVPTPFQNEEELYALIHTIAEAYGLQVDESKPLASFRLRGGTRVEVILPPISLVGPAVTVMKVRAQPIQLEDLLNSGAITQPAADFLRACVQARVDIAISGAAGAGKSSLLKIMASWIPQDERIFFLQSVGVPGFTHPHLVTLETRPANIEGCGAITLRDLVQCALRMRPDRILVEELLGGEAFELVEAMNRGHDGCLFTLNSFGPRDTLARLEHLLGLGNPEFPLIALREQISAAIDLVVHMEVMRDGSRKVVNITEVSGMENGVIMMTDIFLFELTGYENGAVQGRLRPTGLVPKFLDYLKASGIVLPDSMFAS
jgi:pilus assembly protein CpaF